MRNKLRTTVYAGLAILILSSILICLILCRQRGKYPNTTGPGTVQTSLNGTSSPTARPTTPTNPKPTNPPATNTMATTKPTDTTEPSEPVGPHNCEYVEMETVKPSCTLEGYIRYVCSLCGAEITTTMGITAHNYQYVDTIPATGTEPAYNVYRCEGCGGSRYEPLE